VTTLLEAGNGPEQILELVLGELGVEVTDRIPVEFYCNCSKERVEKVLISLNRKELQELIDEGRDVELNCHFCNTDYVFTVEELKQIQRRGHHKK
ncbi:MAG: Hsp33 family molecular chaperone HslO, partial [Lachnospiraceae bacterium]|nr:Hsp33 family molecular chaperone HslO [Lachnospiraceae bacterium]